MKFNEYTIADVSIVKGGKRLPKGVTLITERNTHPYIRVRDLNDCKVLKLNMNYEYVDDETQKSIARYIVSSGDIVLSIVGTIGLVAIVGESLAGANLTENCVKITQMNGVDREYLYYYLKSAIGQAEIAKGTVGAVQPKLPIKNIQAIKLALPSMVEQKKIALILKTLDDKIELNNDINENLEQQAEAFFKAWFLDYIPWNGNVPSSWIDGKLGDFADIKRGGSPRPIQKYLSNSGLRWLKISDVTSLQTPFVIDIKDHIIEDGLKKTVLLKEGSLVLSNSATPGIPKILDVDSCIHDGWLYFPQSKFSREYLYLYFKYIRQQLVNLSNGSVFNNLKTDILKNYPTILPDKETLQRFESIVNPIFLEIQNRTRESHQLTDIRDALLPKLMSGELDVSNIDL